MTMPPTPTARAEELAGHDYIFRWDGPDGRDDCRCGEPGDPRAHRAALVESWLAEADSAGARRGWEEGKRAADESWTAIIAWGLRLKRSIVAPVKPQSPVNPYGGPQ